MHDEGLAVPSRGSDAEVSPLTELPCPLTNQGRDRISASLGGKHRPALHARQCSQSLFSIGPPLGPTVDLGA